MDGRSLNATSFQSSSIFPGKYRLNTAAPFRVALSSDDDDNIDLDDLDVVEICPLILNDATTPRDTASQALWPHDNRSTTGISRG